MKNLLKGGQGRKLDEADGWLFWWLGAAALLLGLCSCGIERRETFSELDPQGDFLPAPWMEETIAACRKETGSARPVSVTMCADIDDLNRRANPKRKEGFVSVACCNPATGQIWLSRKNRFDLAHECGHVFLQLMDSDAEEKKCDDFAEKVLKNMSRVERGLCRVLTGNDE